MIINCMGVYTMRSVITYLRFSSAIQGAEVQIQPDDKMSYSNSG